MTSAGLRKWEGQINKTKAGHTPAEAGSDVCLGLTLRRSHHVIASAGKDYRVRIHHLKYSDRGQVMHSADEVREIDTKSEVSGACG
eukprot:14772-Eustigmatos_ZCMA.PRE.1